MDYHTAQEEFSSLIDKLQPWVLSNFIMWIDLKVAEYKVLGRILPGTERSSDLSWPRHTNISLRTENNESPIISKQSKMQDGNQEQQNANAEIQTNSLNNTSPRTVTMATTVTSDKQSCDSDSKVTSTSRHSNKDLNFVKMNAEIISLDSDEENDRFESAARSVNVVDLSKQSGHRSDSFGVKIEPSDDYDNVVFDEENSSETVDNKLPEDSRSLQDLHFSLPAKTHAKKIKVEQTSPCMEYENTSQKSLEFYSKHSRNHNRNHIQTQRIFRRQVAPRQNTNANGLNTIYSDRRRSLEIKQAPHKDMSEVIDQSLEDFPVLAADHNNLPPSFSFDIHDGQHEIVPVSVIETDIDYNQTRTEQETMTSTHNSNSNMEFEIQFPETAPSSFKMCSICFSIFTKIDELQAHFITEHPESDMNPACVFCGGSFPSDAVLKRHIACNHLSKTSGFQCIFCGKEFLQAQHFQGHLNQHRGVQPYKCQRCEKTFTYKTHLTCHMRQCGGIDGQFKCDICGRVFLARSYLNQHIDGMHNSENPKYKCGFCGEKFVWRGSLKRHKKLKCLANPERYQETQ